MEKAHIGTLIRILENEGGAPPGAIVQVKSHDKFGDIKYDWQGSEWLASPNDGDIKYYELVNLECNMLRQLTSQFVLMYEMNVLTENNMKFLYVSIKEALRR